MDVNDLRAQRAARREEVRSLNDLAIREERDLTEDEQRSWESAQRDIAHLSSTIQRLDYIRGLDEETVVVQGSAATPVVRQVLPLARSSSRRELATLPRDERYADAFYSYLRHGFGGMESEQRSALQPYFGTASESRAMGTTSVAVGGALIPQEFYRRLIEALKEIGGVRRSRSTIVQTDSGAPMPIPLVDDTANIGAILAENTAVTEQDVAFTQKTLGSFMYTSKLVRVSFQMLQDSAFDIESWLSRALAMRLGRAINAHFTNGTGGGTQPEGVITGAQSYGTTATGAGNVTGITYDNLVNLIHSVDPSYRDNAEFMFHDSTLRAIKQLKDGQQRPLWQQDMALGERPTILGYPYVINQDVPVMAASAKSILFGDFSYYLIRDVQDIRLLRLDERYADFLQTGFLAFLRTDGLLANAGGTNSPVKYYANSASLTQVVLDGYLMTTTEDVYGGTFGGTGLVDVPPGGASGGGGSGVAYCTLDQLKLQLGVPADDTRSDLTLNGIIEAVSRLIDAECKTQFYASTDTLFYTPTSWYELLIDDILSVSSLATDTGYGTYTLIWAPTDYVLAPYNAPTSSQARPYWRIETAYGGRYTFPIGVRRGVMVTARRGFCELSALPGGINAVCLRESLFQAQANVTPYGMTPGDGGGAAAPTSVSLSNYSKLMLAQFKRVVHG